VTRPNPDAMIPYADALAIVWGKVRPLPIETVPLDKSLGRWLARDVKARAHSPRFEQSAMDGYAVRMADVQGCTRKKPVTLDLVDEMPAGDQRSLTLKRGTTMKVFTGSRLPRGTEAVVMKEYVTPGKGNATIAWKVGKGDHIRLVGEEYRRGDLILPAGLRVTPPVVGMVATLGLDKAAVRRIPTALVITMGNELVAPGSSAGTGQIPDSNGPAVCAALRAMGLVKVRHKRVRDKLPLLVKAMRDGLDKDDLVVTVGGASVGDYDFVHEARRELGVSDLFKRVAIKPGKPNIFGLYRGRVPVFGLPGNPVSALASLHQLVKPAVQRLGGAAAPSQVMVPVKMAKGFRKKPGRLGWLRGSLRLNGHEMAAELATGQGSHMLSGLALADALVEIPADTAEVAPGETVLARLLDWS